jgi:hypothetical protein
VILQLIDDGKATRHQIEAVLKTVEGKLDDVKSFYFSFYDGDYDYEFSNDGIYYRFHDWVKIPDDIDAIHFTLNKESFEYRFDIYLAFFGRVNQDIEATYDNESCLNGVILELFSQAWVEKMFPLEPQRIPTSRTLHILKKEEKSFFQLEKAKQTPPEGVIFLEEGPNACIGEKMTYIYWGDSVWKIETEQVFL